MERHSDLTGTNLHSPKVATNAGDPTGSVDPKWKGRLIFDTSGNVLYVATADSGNTNWQRVNAHSKPDVIRSYPSVAGIVDLNTAPSPDDDRTSWIYPNLGNAYHNLTHNHASGSTGLAFGDETDGSKQTSYIRADYFDAEEIGTAGAQEWLFYFTLPLNFQGWGANGIRLKHRHVGLASGIGGGGTPIIVQLECLDPTTLVSFATPVVGERIIANTGVQDSTYAWVTISQVDLNAEGIGNPGGLLPLRLRYGLDVGGSGPGDAIEFHIGSFELDLSV